MSYCKYKKNAQVSELINKYGETHTDAMYEQVSQEAPVLVPNKAGKLVYSELWSVIKAKIKDTQEAWSEYLGHSFRERDSSDLYDSGEPKYIESSKIYVPGVEDVDDLISKKSDIENKRMMESLNALNKKVERSIKRYTDAPERKQTVISDLIQELGEASSEQRILKYIIYTKNHTFGAAKRLSEMEGNDTEYLKNLPQYRELLTLTEPIMDMAKMAVESKSFKDFLKKNKLEAILKETISNRTELVTAIESVGEKFTIDHIKANYKGEEVKFRNERKAWYKKNEVNKKGNTPAETRAAEGAMESWLDDQMLINKDKIDGLTETFALKMVKAKAFTIGGLDANLMDPNSINDVILNLTSQKLDKADFKKQQVVRAQVNKMQEVFPAFAKATSKRKSVKAKYREILEHKVEQQKDGSLKVVKDSVSGHIATEYYSEFYEVKNRLESEEQVLVNKGDYKGAAKKAEEYQAWLEDNAVLMGGLPQPNDKWINPQWKVLTDLKNRNSPIWTMYDTLMESQKLSDEYLPYNGMQLGTLLPQIEKGFYEDAEEKGGLEALKLGFGKAVKFRVDDTRYGEVDPLKTLDDINSAHLKSQRGKVPLYYRNKVDPEDLSLDLATTFTMNFDNAVNHHFKTEIQSEVELMQDVVKNRKMWDKWEWKEYEKGDEIDPLVEVVDGPEGKRSRRATRTSSGADSGEYKAMESTIRDRLYGIRSESGPAADKASQLLMQYTGQLMLSLNWSSGLRNLTQGNLANWMEAAGGGLFDQKNYANGVSRYFGKYGSELIARISDIGKVAPSSYVNLMVDHFNAYTEWSPINRKYANSGFLKNAAKGSNLTFFNSGPEHMIQGILMFSVLDTFKVKGPDGKMVAMHHAYEVVNGKLEIKEGFNITQDDEFKVSQKIKEIKKQLQGNYDPENKSAAQRTWYGAMGMMFRKWMAPGIKRRYRGLDSWEAIKDPLASRDKYFNINTNRFEEGMYFTTYKYVRGLIKDIQAFGLDTKAYHYTNRNTMTTEDKSAVITTALEIAVGAGLFFGALKLRDLMKEEDDETRKWHLANFAYLMKSLSSEFLFYTNPFDTIKLLQNPSATVNTVERILKFLQATVTLDMMDTIESGSHAGENAWVMKASTMVPSIRSFWTYDPVAYASFVF